MRPVRLLFLVGGFFFGMLLFLAVILSFAKMDLVVAGKGSLDALRWKYITPEVKGIVKEVKKGIGDSITEGEVIAVLDSADAQKRLDQAVLTLSETEREEAAAAEQVSYLKDRRRLTALMLANFAVEREKASLKVDGAVAARKKAESAAANAEQGLAASQIRYQDAVRERDDQEKLSAAGLVSERVVAKARNAAELAKIAVATAGNDLASARQELEARKAAEALASTEFDNLTETPLHADLDTAEFELRRGELQYQQAGAKRQRLAAERDRLIHQVDLYTIRAPMTGVIQSLHLYESEMSGTDTSGGSVAVVGKVAADDPFIFVMEVQHLDVIKVRPEQEVEIRVDAYPYRRYSSFKGVVYCINRGTSEGTYTVKIRVEKSIYPLRAGMSGYGRIKVGRVNVLSYLLGFAEDKDLAELRKKADEIGCATVPYDEETQQAEPPPDATQPAK